MMPTGLPLLAEGATRITTEWKNWQTNADLVLPLLAVAAVTAYVVYMYRRDATELPPWLAVLLTCLRTGTFLLLLLLYLYPQRRIDEDKPHHSRVAVLVDTSFSMNLSADEPSSVEGRESRSQQAAAVLKQTDFLQELRKVHDVIVIPFDTKLHRDRAVSLPKLSSTPPAEEAQESSPGEGLQGEEIDWSKLTKPTGPETRLGQALLQALNEEANLPLSGVIVFTDGGWNAGVHPETAIEAANLARVVVCTVGLGSDEPPPNVRVASFSPPPRAYPGDPCAVTGQIQAWRMAGKTVEVQLLSRKAGSGAGAAKPGTGDILDSKPVTLGADGQEVPVEFQITPGKTLERCTLCLKVLAPKNDRDPDDNLREADMEVVDLKTRVLLFAGGPTREYQFLRNQLHREFRSDLAQGGESELKTTICDVFLQTAKPGISQDANEILQEFPDSRETLYKYDCIVAFDPDWRELSAEQVNLLESWVAERGGGLILVGGTVHTNRSIDGWLRNKTLAKIHALYPVQFSRESEATDTIADRAEDRWPIDFTREGLQADFLSLDDASAKSREAWAAFPGVFSYLPVRGPKPGATVLARFSDPRAAVAGELPVYMAWQFYGSGSVFYLGSGEMWRLRETDESYFEHFYTKLIRHVSRGRLLSGSTRGTLLVKQERCWLGGTVDVQAFRLADAQHEPLKVPSVSLQVIQPNQTLLPVVLRADRGREGCYSGQFSVLHEGDYRLELPLPESPDERLTQRIHVEIPNLEREHPQRNGALLSSLATGTKYLKFKSEEDRLAGKGEEVKGEYYVGVNELLNPPAAKKRPVELLEDRSTITTITGPSPEWEQKWLRWMMYSLFVLLCLEWTLRRLFKLA